MAHVSSSTPLQDLLAEQLPKHVPFTFYHYSTPPSTSSALFSAPPHARAQRTYCESHFLAASIVPNDTTSSTLPNETITPQVPDGTTASRVPNNTPASNVSDELLVLAIEVLVYTTRSLTTIFVSKADSTGCLSELQLPRGQSGSPLKAICGTFVSWLARERQRQGKKVVVSLFARAQDQYLFPASIENKNKHVLDDRGLVKWWCRVLDPIIRQYKAEDAPKPFPERLAAESSGANGMFLQSDTTAMGYLVIPGFETYDTLRCIPPPSTPNTPRRWAAAHPLLEIAPCPTAPPRCLVPHFPDDPKARFLDELDDELPDRVIDATVEAGTPSHSNGQWKSVKTLDQFWEFMAYRQECSSGRIVGFIWVVITPPKPSIPEEDEEMFSQRSFSHPLSQNDSQESVSLPRRKKRKMSERRRKARLEYGPIPLVLPKIMTRCSNQSAASNASGGSTTSLPPETSPYFTWPTASRGTICFSTKDYDRAHEILIHQSFANRDAAGRSTKKWKEEVAVLGGVDNWSWTVTGKKEDAEATSAPTNGVMPITVMGVRQKRRPEVVATQTEGAHVLGEGLVRKKTRMERIPDAGASAANGVNTLGGGLVRKKVKG